MSRSGLLQSIRCGFCMWHTAPICLGGPSVHEFYLTTVLRPNKTYTPLIYSAEARVFIWHVSDGQKDKSLFRARLPFDPGVGWGCVRWSSARVIFAPRRGPISKRIRLSGEVRQPPGGCQTKPGRDRVLAIRRSRSPRPCLINKNEYTPLAS